MVLQARERSLNEIREAAIKVLTPLHVTRSYSAANIPTVRVELSNEMLTVVNSDHGFAIVANDDAFNAVIGYSDKPFVLDENNSLAWFINAAGESMKARMAESNVHYAPTLPDAGKYKTSIEPLVSTTWNQDKPYNNLCPKDSRGNSYPSGCVATALSQIMKYHNYPEHGYGQKQYSFKPADGVGELLSANFGETTYLWNKMLDNYVAGKYSDDEGNAVATLMLHAGVAVEMQYTPTGSGAYSSEAKNGLIKNFGYNKNIGIVYRDYYSQEEWMNIVFTELNAARPIYYAGADASRGGHAFVIDGYDENGLVHVNWGWGATGGNGYYDISLLNPSGYSFSVGQDMLVGIDLPDADIQYESHLVSDYELEAAKVAHLLNVSVGQAIWNLNGDAWTGELGIVMQGNGKTYVLAQKTVKTTADRYNVLANIDGTLGGLLQMPKDIADGEYRLFVGAMDENDKNWSLVRRKVGLVNSCIINVSNGTFTITNTTDDTWTGITSVYPDSHDIKYYDLYGRKADASSKGILIRKQGNKVSKIFAR